MACPLKDALLSGGYRSAARRRGELICKCFAIDDLMIKRVVKANGLQSIEEVVNYTKAGGACTSCHEKIEWVLDEALAEMAEAGIDVAAVARANQKVAAVPQPIAATAKAKVPVKCDTQEPEHVKRLALIEQVSDEVRRAVQADGGDIQLVDVEDHLVFVSMSGNRARLNCLRPFLRLLMFTVK